MAKRPNPRAIKAAHNYTIDQAANALGVSTGTIRSWVRSDLPLLKGQRPFLILGGALRHFLEDRAKAAKVPLKQDQLYCLRCKAGRVPMGLLVDCIPQTAKTARLLGRCGVCGGTCNRMISRSEIDHFSRIFCVAFNEGQQA